VSTAPSLMLNIRISHVCWWLEPCADAVMALRTRRFISGAIALRLLMILCRHGLRLDTDEPVTGERRHG
jgi:hypothetical protein